MYAASVRQIDHREDLAWLAFMVARAGSVDKDGTFHYKTFRAFFDREKFFCPENEDVKFKIAETQKRINGG